MLIIDHLTKTYGTHRAVDDLSLHILPGEIFGFIGHNGAGKTTTLKSVAGILPFDSGRITVDGVDLAADPLACKRRMAYLPDNPDLYEFMKGEVRYASLELSFPDNAKELFAEAEANAKEKYEYYKRRSES